MHSPNDARLLDAIPDYLCIGALLKAQPATEGSGRFVYFEASNEKVDQQHEMVLAKALEASAEHYLKFGNVDIDHLTILGKPNPAKGWAGIPKPEQYEVGRPVKVRIEGRSTFVKCELYQGTGELAEQANMVWESMTALKPAQRWYPSVGGAILAKSVQIDPATKSRIGVVESVRWTNVALSRTPVNQHVGGATTVPIAALAKSWTGTGWNLAKALEAGYATDSAGMTGGQALSMQSLDGAKKAPNNYFDFREKLSDAISAGRIAPVNTQSMVDHCVKEHGMSHDEAAEHVERFTRDLKREMERRSKA